jgi:hypothetical protein
MFIYEQMFTGIYINSQLYLYGHFRKRFKMQMHRLYHPN